MNTNLISDQIEEYIIYKRGLGYKIKIESDELRRFAAYTRNINYEGSLTVDIALSWVSLKPKYSRWYMARRLEIIRTFAQYISIFDPNAQIPQRGIFGKCHGKITPYIFTEKEINTLMEIASDLFSPDGLRAITIPTAIGLMWVTGMRPGEVCKLMNEDVELNNGYITIKETKFSKSRTLPIHVSTIQKLNEYKKARDKLRKDYLNQHFFIMTGGNSLILRNLEYAWQIIRESLLADTERWNRRPPRLYDIRHSFACNTILRWLQEGININNKILYLSTYLGHAKISDTYWYLTGTPEIMTLLTNNFEEYFYGNEGDFHES